MTLEAPSVKVAKSSLYLSIQSILGNILMAFLFMVTAWILPQSDIGVISALGMIINLFATLATLAIPQAVTKYIAENIGRRKFDLAKTVFDKAILIGLVAGLASVAISLALIPWISMFLFGSAVSQYLVYMLSLCVFMAIFNPFLGGIIGGIQKFKESLIINIVSGAISTGASIILLYQGFGVVSIITGWIVGGFIVTILSSIVVFSSFKRTEVNNSPSLTTKLIVYSLPLYFTSILNYLLGYIDKYIILLWIDLKSLGIYAVAVAAPAVISALINSAGSALFPKLSEIYGGLGEEALKEASVKASRYIFLLFIPISVGLAVVAYPIITLFFGDGYGLGASSLAVISLTNGLTCFSVITTALFLSLAATRVFLEAGVLSVLADVTVCIAFIPILGITGAALGKLALSIVGLIYGLYRLKHIHGLYFDREAFVNAWIGSIAMAVVVGFVEFIYMSKFMLPAYILVGGIVYLVLLKLLHAVKSQDIILAKQFLPTRLGGAVNFLAKFLNVK